eukprot:6205390-Pleurochrysis_carterae.AAC.5
MLHAMIAADAVPLACDHGAASRGPAQVCAWGRRQGARGNDRRWAQQDACAGAPRACVVVVSVLHS